MQAVKEEAPPVSEPKAKQENAMSELLGKTILKSSGIQKPTNLGKAIGND